MAIPYPHPNVRLAERVLTAAAGLGLLALAARMPRARRPLVSMSTAVLLRSLTGYCPAYAAAGVTLNGHASDTKSELAGAKGAHLDMTLTIFRSPDEVYAFWRDLSQLSRAFPSSIQAESLNTTDSHWSIEKAGVPVANWTARIINDEPGRLIAWKTIGDASVISAGSVRFQPTQGGHSTDVHVRFQYAPPLGRAGAAVADMLGQGADAAVRATLDEVKRLLEGRPAATAPALQ
jgi:uncharacterized membrane protein